MFALCVELNEAIKVFLIWVKVIIMVMLSIIIIIIVMSIWVVTGGGVCAAEVNKPLANPHRSIQHRHHWPHHDI